MMMKLFVLLSIFNDVASKDHIKKKEIKHDVIKGIDMSELVEKLNYQYTTMMIQTHLEY